MKKAKTQNETPRMGRHRLFAAASMLVIAAILLTGATFAWLTLSLAPEVTGISTQIGANGSLEIALLNAETRGDLSKIRTSVGSSLANNKTANNSWGNLVDVNAEEYGLSAITLMPARLNIEANPSGGYSVADNYLLVPTYGYDGRITHLSGDTYGMTYGENGFMGSLTAPDFGVRGIGTSSALSVQGSALVMAKTNVITYTNSAKNAAVSALTKNADDLFNLVIAHNTDSNKQFTNDDKAVLTAMLGDLGTAYTYVDLALRQGILAHAAANIGDEDLFNQARTMILDTSKDLSALLADQSEAMDFEIPETLQTWVNEAAALKNSLNEANTKNTELNDGSYTWAELRTVMNSLMNLDKIYIGENLFGNMSADDFAALLGSTFEMTLAPGSGIFADLADFTGNYSTWINAMGSKVEVATLSAVDPAYLTALSNSLSDLTAASGSNATEIKLSQLYGYALDLAFRCNAPLSDLLLQTGAISRISNEESGASTMGAGSYMEFSTDDDHFTPEQMITLMDAVRVAFLDDMGNVMGIAKLNTSNRTIVSGVITAPLYLYDFTVEYDEESNGNILVMGERRSKDDNAITALDQNVAKAVTTLVWLDGDIVDNTMVSAEAEASLTGILNLQFASSANLIPAENGDLQLLTPKKSDLNALIAEHQATYDAGQGMYTTTSWTPFADAFEHATNVYLDANANEAEVLAAATRLYKAQDALEQVSLQLLKDKIDAIRGMMGQTDDLACLVLEDAENKRVYTVKGSYTDEQFESKIGTINRVDYTNNLKDNGNGVMSPVYTDESWSKLADALYDAEAVYNHNTYTDYVVMDQAISALQEAFDTLVRNLYFEAFEYQDELYYFAVTDDSDTYGKWYDSEHNRIVSDLTILKLDANATLAKIAKIEGVEDKISMNHGYLSPSINILYTEYPALRNEEIIGIHWNTDGPFVQTAHASYKAYLQFLVDLANTYGYGSNPIPTRAKSVIRQTNPSRADVDTAMKEMERYCQIAAVVAEAVSEDHAQCNEIIDADLLLRQNTITTEQAQLAIDGLNQHLTAHVIIEDMTQAQYDALAEKTAKLIAIVGEADETVVAANDLMARYNAYLADAENNACPTSFDATEIYLAVITKIYDSCMTLEEYRILYVATAYLTSVLGEDAAADEAIIAANAKLAEYEAYLENIDTGEVPLADDALLPAVNAKLVENGKTAVNAVMTNDEKVLLTLALNYAMSIPLPTPEEGDELGETETEATTEAVTEAVTEPETEAETYLPGTGTDLVEPDPEYWTKVTNAMAQAQDMLSRDYVGDGEYADVMAVLNDLLESAGRTPVTSLWTEDQRMVLVLAVNAAKDIEGYENLEIRFTVEAIEGLLNRFYYVTDAEAIDALNAINTQFASLNMKQFTIANSVPRYIAVGSEIFEVVNGVDYGKLFLPDDVADITGVTTLKAVLLTRSGIIFTVEKSVTVYAPADNTEILLPNTAPAGGEMIYTEFEVETDAEGNEVLDEDGNPVTVPVGDPIWNGAMSIGASADLKVKLNQSYYEVEVQAEEPAEGEDPADPETQQVFYTTGEKISTYSWSSGNSNVATVSVSDGVCTVKAVAAGRVTISVTVTTDMGNSYTTSYTITVTNP